MKGIDNENNMNNLNLTLEKTKTTPGTVRFTEVGNEDHPVQIYLTKDRSKELGNPESITIAIEKTAE
jgi:hypothetical protein